MAALDARLRQAIQPLPTTMTTPSESPKPAAPTFRSTLIRVMAVQVGALLLLWLLQSRYTP
jgi:hypothetical protein